MWGVAIWDGVKRRLILSRDRLGVKPLHYAKLPSRLVFASEIKGVLASGLIQARLNRRCAADFLRWGSVNHSDETFFEGVREFPPGHVAEIDPERPHDWEPQTFWRLATPDRPESNDMDTAAQRFRHLFLSAVSLRMRSDVPVGSCLSGGLDSSSIVCAVQQNPSAGVVPFHTFTSSSHAPRFDERRWADLVSAHARTTAHHVFPDVGGFLRDLPQLLWHQEEPFTTASIYAQWEVMRAAREAEVPVLLDGQGADEILCGYRKYQFFYLRELANAGRWLLLARELTMLLRFGDRGLWRWREGARYLPGFFQRRLTSMEELIHPDFRGVFLSSSLALTAAKTVAARQIDDLLHFSVPSLLRYEDRNSMAWAIESRVPFLDYRLVEFAVALPAMVKLFRGRSKAVLRTGLRELVPKTVLDRRDKMGFVTPQAVWMRCRLGEAVAARFGSSNCRLVPFADRAKLKTASEASLRGQEVLQQEELFRWYVFDMWIERFEVSC